MTFFYYLIFSLITQFFIYFTFACAKEYNSTFPNNLSIGTASSHYQVEGAWNISDKGESIWDRYTHSHSEKIVNGDNGDIACDSYHKFKEDIRLVKEMGMKHYRFSISWSRILPTGYSNIVSKVGVKYYDDLIDELLKSNIKPYVTLHHFDHPQLFQEFGGWTNEVMVDLFGDFARIIFREFGNRVKMFSTINDPNFCKFTYNIGIFPPGIKLGRHPEYMCVHNVLKAHARAYHIYDDEFRARQNGKIGIVLGCAQFYSKNKSDNESAEIAFQYDCGRYAQPIFTKKGDYPDVMKERIAVNSKFEGLQRSRLPTFSKKWIDYIRGTSDYFGLNHYSSMIAEPAPKSNDTIYYNDEGLVYSYDSSWPSTPNGRIKIFPQGFGDLLRKIKNDYGNPPIYIMENGLNDDGTLNDNQRMIYLYYYMREVLTAINIDKCNIKSYTIWSLLDNFEWNEGYSQKFGLFQVDFNSLNRTRTPKGSVSWIKNVLRKRELLLPPV